MNADEDAEETTTLLSVAGSISRGAPVDWSELRRGVTDPEESAVVAELQVLESLSKINQPAPARWGAFDVADEIGHGSFGTVYRATDSNLDVEVALKVIRFDPDDASVDVERALKEARLLAQITHPNVVRVYHAELIGHEVGVAMELIRGQTLAELVNRQGPFSAGEAVVIGLDLCRALAAVHGAGLLHGDIKAHNVMRAEGGRTVLMDFGAGKDTKRTPPSAGPDLAGTPLYLAPEVFAGQGQSKSSDIYSLGVLMYHLVTGSYPVEGRTREEVERQHALRTPRTPLRDVRQDLPDGFIRVVDRALAANRDDRYQSAGELEEAFHRIERPVPSPTRGRLAWKPLIMVGAATFCVALLVAGAYLAWPPTSVDTNRSGSFATVATSGAAGSSPGTDVADQYRIEASLYRAQDGTSVRMEQGAHVTPGDRLFLEVRSSVATNVYVVNEDDLGEAYLLFPLPGLDASNPLAPSTRHRLPGTEAGEPIYWQVTSAGGREHFLVFASPGPPSPAFERLFAGLPQPIPGKLVAGSRLSTEALGVLRGVGGLSSSVSPRNGPLRLSPEFAAPLGAAEEAARGVWVRQITLQNPGP